MSEWKIEDLEKEIEDLKARCARLRAALAGVVESAVAVVGPSGHPQHLTIEGVLKRAESELMSAISFRAVKAALEVLRETAPTKEVSDGV